ncbi:hypothetical protein BHM03_00014209 [Ensete ventricosum]|nr:hypothetical protein BHM03_00014209 [Ensete ventricosum]
MAGESARLGPAHVRKVVSIDRESGEGARGRSHRVCIRRYRAPHSTVIFVQALKVMKSCHDFDLVVIEGSLAVIYSTPEEYSLHAPLPGFRQEIEDLKSGASLEAIVVIERQATELLTMNEKLKADRDEAGLQLDDSNKEINDNRNLLTDAQKQIKDMLARG